MVVDIKSESTFFVVLSRGEKKKDLLVYMLFLVFFSFLHLLFISIALTVKYH